VTAFVAWHVALVPGLFSFRSLEVAAIGDGVGRHRGGHDETKVIPKT